MSKMFTPARFQSDVLVRPTDGAPTLLATPHGTAITSCRVSRPSLHAADTLYRFPHHELKQTKAVLSPITDCTQYAASLCAGSTTLDPFWRVQHPGLAKTLDELLVPPRRRGWHCRRRPRCSPGG